ncbi:hypothetical protein CNR22_07650 [Sphingobacteriaceae bacterium]|nr:hypothetical protein CNR22_07650 [Sphingobacteriaceae bacterium]
MKKQVLIGSVLLAAISSFSQSGIKQKPTGLINTKIISQQKFGKESMAPVANVNPVNPSAPAVASGSKNTSITWQNFTSSMNIYGVIISYCKPLQWNDELNAVSFIHRKSPTYVTSPPPGSTAATGAINAMISLDCGTTWDSTAVFQNNSHWGRYPGGAIYNPAGNTNINNAYVVAAGPTTGANTTTWIGNFYASKKLGTYDNIPPVAPGAQQVFTTSTGASANIPSRHDFAAYGFNATDDGKVRVLAGITDDISTSDTAVMLMTGTFNTSTSTFDWAGKVFDPPTTVSPSDNTENWVSRPIMAWNETGKVGYVVIMGSRLGATKSNVGNQPIVYKTTDFGVTWTLENGINFDSGAFNDVKMRIWPTSVGGDTIPNFYWGEGIDCAVDANNKLHIFTSVLGHASGDPDSLNFINQWGTELYLWPHEATAHPFLYDFVYDGDNATPKWSHILIDSMSTEGPSGTSGSAGYSDNPWDADATNSNAKVRIDARLQMSRTPNGKQLLYTWAESDTLFTDAQKKWNVLPNIKGRLFDVDDDTLSPTEIDLTIDGAAAVASHAMYHFISPKFKLVSRTANQITVDLPTTVSNSSPYAQLTTNQHWYACAQMDFERPATTGTVTNPVGIAENSANSANNSSIYPNPAKNNATLRMDLASNSKVNIQVMNAVGQVVKTISSEGQTGTNSFNVDLNGLSSGIYFVNVKVNTASSTKKLVIE